MNKERAAEIERLVIYSNLKPMPEDIDAQSAFEIGLMIGRMQTTLRQELEKENEE